MDKESLKEQFIKLYSEGKNFSQIGELTGWSREFVRNLIKNEPEILKRKCSKKIKVSKRKDNNQMYIYIPTEFIEKLGVSRDKQKNEYVNIFINEKDKSIIIKKT